MVSEVVIEKTNDELTEALKSYKANPFSWWRILLIALTIIVSILTFRIGGSQYKTMLAISDPLNFELEETVFDNVAKLNFESNPKHKGYFMQYALTQLDTEEGIDDNLLILADDIDPENGLYHYLAAGHKMRDFIKKLAPKNIKGFNDREEFSLTTEYEILDKKKYDEALEYIIEAGKRKGIKNHGLEIYLEKLNKISEQIPQDYVGRMATIVESSRAFYSIEFLNTSTILSAKFDELSRTGTKEEFKLWKNEYLKFIEAQLGQDITFLDMLVMKAAMQNTLPNMRAAAAHIGMNEEVEKITNLLDLLFVEREELIKQTKSYYDLNSVPDYSRFGYIHYVATTPILNSLPSDSVLNMNENTWSTRLLEHALVGRILAFISLIAICILCICMWIFYWNKPKEKRGMSLKVLNSLSLLDGFLIVVIGVIIPVIGYVLINEKTEFGAREWGLSEEVLTISVLQFYGMIFTVITMSYTLLRRRLSSSLPEIVTPVRWCHWCLPCASLVAMMLVGFCDSRSETIFLTLSLLILLISTLAWIGLSIGFFIKSDKLVRLSIYRGLLSLYSVTIIIMMVLMNYYHSQEFEYVAQDVHLALKEEHLGLSKVEFLVSQEMRKEGLKNLELIK